MTRNVILFSTVFVVSLLGLSCSPSPSTTPIATHRIGSLKLELASLREVAFAWHEDAYLVHASVVIEFPGDLWVISTEFRSPSDSQQSLNVRLEQDGTNSSRKILWKVPVNQITPITDEDWPIDSQE